MAGFPLVIAALALSIYINTCRNGFTFDDFHKVLENPVVTSPDWAHPGSFFAGPSGRGPAPDRAVPQMVYAIEYSLWGDHPFGYHLINVLLHTGVALLLYVLVARLFPGKRRLAFLAAILFACHPIHTHVVASVIGLGELLSSLCLLLALWIYIRGSANEGTGWSWGYALTLPIMVIGALSKETASWTLPFVGAAVDVYRFVVPRRMSPRQYLPFLGRRFLKFYLPWLAVLVGMAMSFLSATSPPEVAANYLILLPWGERILAVMGIFMRYIHLLIWPFRLSCDYSYNQLCCSSQAVQFLWTAGGVAVMLAGAVLAWFSLRKKGAYFLALFIFAVNYGIISNILLVINVSMAERLVYAASIGFCLVVGLALESLLSHCARTGAGRGRRTAVWTLIILILFAWSVRTWTRNRDWQDNFTLFSSSCRVCPGSSRLNFNLGIEYMERGRLDRSIAHYEKAVAAVPWHALYHANLGKAYMKAGKLDLAITEFKQSTRLDPEHSGGFVNLGGALIDKGDFSKAFACLTIACELGSDQWQAFFNMGKLCVAAGRLEPAAEAYQRALTLNPEHWNGWNRLGAIHLRSGRPREALAAFRTALTLRPNYKEAHNNLGLACIRLGRKEQAIRAFQRALAIDPGFNLARNNLERLMMEASGR